MGSRIPTSTGVPRSHGDQQQRRSPIGLPRWLSLPVFDLSPSPLAHLLALISWQPDLEHGGGYQEPREEPRKGSGGSGLPPRCILASLSISME
jgi:hypothetical protein